MKEYNGYPSYSQWNQSLWINNDESLYARAYNLCSTHGITKASRILFHELEGSKTPDGIAYNRTGIRGALKDIL